MDQEKNEMKEYLVKKGKATTKNSKLEKSKLGALSKIKSKGLALIGFVKKYGYKFLKFMVFIGFTYKVETLFLKMRTHVSKNGGFRKQGMGMGMGM